MAIAIALPGFNNLGRRWPLFYFWWTIFSTYFLSLAKTWRNSINLSLIFLQLQHRISFILARRSYVRGLQITLKRLNFVKMLATFIIINATDPLVQNMTKIVCLLWLTFDVFNYKPLWTMLNFVRQFFFKTRVAFHRFISETKSVTSIFVHFWHK